MPVSPRDVFQAVAWINFVLKLDHAEPLNAQEFLLRSASGRADLPDTKEMLAQELSMIIRDVQDVPERLRNMLPVVVPIYSAGKKQKGMLGRLQKALAHHKSKKLARNLHHERIREAKMAIPLIVAGLKKGPGWNW